MFRHPSMAAQPQPAHSELRNCCRCGSEFRGDSRALVCLQCRKAPSSDLSFRERQLVELVAQGKANKEIAYELHLSEGTVKEYLNRIFRKLQVTNRTALAVWAICNQAGGA